MVCHRREQFREGLRGVTFLPEAQDADDKHGDGDDDSVGRIVEKEGQSRRSDENEDQRALESDEEERDLVSALPGPGCTGAGERESLPGLSGREALAGRTELLEQVCLGNTPIRLPRHGHLGQHNPWVLSRGRD